MYWSRLENFKTLHRRPCERETIRLYPVTLQNADKEIRQWTVVVLVEGQMLSVARPTARKQDWQIFIFVRTSVAEIRRHQDVRLI